MAAGCRPPGGGHAAGGGAEDLRAAGPRGAGRGGAEEGLPPRGPPLPCVPLCSPCPHPHPALNRWPLHTDPDKNPGDAAATEKFQRLAVAYKILTGEEDASDSDWSSDEEWTHGTKNAGRQKSAKNRRKKEQQAQQKGRQAKPRRKRRSKRMDEKESRDFYDMMFGGDVLIMKKPDGGHVVMSFGGKGGKELSAAEKAEKEREEAIRQRAHAVMTSPDRRRGGGDDQLTATIRAALRRDPSLGLKKLTKLVQKEGGLPQANTRMVRDALSALQSRTGPAPKPKDPLEHMLVMREMERRHRSRQSWMHVCILVGSMVAFAACLFFVVSYFAGG